MNRWSLILLLLLIANTIFAQKDKDSVVNNLPVVNGKLIYTDSITVKGHSRATLDNAAKKWLAAFFEYQRPDTLSKDKDTNSSVLSQGILKFRMTTTSLALVKYDFYLVITIKVDCKDNYYTYKIFDIFFVPKSRFFRAVIYYQDSPEYLIGLYHKKHLGLEPALDMGRKKIREYLTRVNDAITACISSLNKAMAN
jgi:hypothetical protein